MKTFNIFVGIDISKLTIDVCVLSSNQSCKTRHFKVMNDIKSITAFLALLQQEVCLQSALFCCEDTGIYTMPLITVMSKQVLDYWVVAAIEIKRSQGLIRGKNNKADAKAIALYAFTHQHTYTPALMPEKQLQQLKLLFTEREKILKAIALLNAHRKMKTTLIKKYLQ